MVQSRVVLESVAVFLWWCFCSGVVVVVVMMFSCGGVVGVVVFLFCWCVCGGVLAGDFGRALLLSVATKD